MAKRVRHSSTQIAKDNLQPLGFWKMLGDRDPTDLGLGMLKHVA